MTVDVVDVVGNPEEAARVAADELAKRTGVAQHSAAVVLGSGWAPAADRLGEPSAVVPMAELPGFLAPGVSGHQGLALSVPVGDQHVLVLLGRTHAYEGHDLAHVVHGVRVAAASGAGTLILTNAAGGLNQEYRVGQPVLINDHLNMTARSPLRGPRFVDLTDAYSPRLIALAREVDPSLAVGVYAGLPGPHYETPAEVRALKTLGADLVGMSTVHETIAARAEGVEVLGVSLVTNIAAGLAGKSLNHAEVLEEGHLAARRVGSLLREVVSRL
ncbi:purine-nucleoside phosphorylase [Segniliparus rugosus]|uniref:Purine nucleoside phosphorylase n=1 Tax=Segniliparus rugosus (strain ATCC BAA-974 / DSM 45345 / CCUG 50838 / CIP 108380 / JCM 13579 / CDC 945) TaxID=679197 RepID=E5XU16_SEGRC|nr:purine-nucleoside phosphorylase [Segniliparus rugosus]EFV12185.1 purine nucleotide phosphorylase [Segniliparus rugosus ATCC BAA-974]